jgi:hypothetical protein
VKIAADRYRVEAEKAERLSELERILPDYLFPRRKAAILVGDTLLFENYRCLSLAAGWFGGLRAAWLESNLELNNAASESVFHRIVLLPYPAVLANPFDRRALIELILLHLHLQLWHGIVCGVKFLNPRSVRHWTLDDLHFVSAPHAEKFFDFPGWTRGDTIMKQVLEGGKARASLARIRGSWLHAGQSRVLWLWYDEDHFRSAPRLAGSHWARIRRFFAELHRGCDTCPACHERKATDVDHRAPFAGGFFQTLPNFQFLCGPCNKAKSKTLVGPDPFKPPLCLPDEYRSARSQGILDSRPPWLGNVRRPRDVHSVLQRLGI